MNGFQDVRPMANMHTPKQINTSFSKLLKSWQI